MHSLTHVSLNNFYVTQITNNSHTSWYTKVFLQQREYTKDTHGQTRLDHYPQVCDKPAMFKLMTKLLHLLSHNRNEVQWDPEEKRTFWSQWQCLCLCKSIWDHTLKPSRDIFSHGRPLTSQPHTLLYGRQ